MLSLCNVHFNNTVPWGIMKVNTAMSTKLQRKERERERNQTTISLLLATCLLANPLLN